VEAIDRSPSTGIRVLLFLLSVAGSGLLFAVGFPPAAPDRLPVLLIAVALAVATAWSPGRAIVGFAFLFPCAGLLARLSGGTDPIAWPALLFGGLAAGWSFRFIYDFESSPEPSPLDAPLSSLLVVWVLATGVAAARASTLWAVFHGLKGRAVNGDGMADAAAIRESLFALSSLASGAVFFRILRRSGGAVREKALKAVLAGVGASAAAAILERAGVVPAETRPFWKLTKRISGGAIDPNSLGLLCALVLVVVLAGILRGARRGRSEPWTAILLLAGLLLSGSRAGFLLLVLGTLVLVGAGAAGSVARRFSLAAAGVLVLLIAGFLLRGSAGTLGSRIAQSFDPNLPVEYRVSARPALWRAAWRLFLRHPIEGVGMGAFSWTFPDLAREERRRLMRDNPGSAYVQALAETGITGLFLTGLFLVAAGRDALGEARQKEGAVAGAGIAVLAFLASLVIGSHWLAPDVSLLFFLLVAVVASPAPEAARSEPRLWKIARAAAVLVFAGAAVASSLATARPVETFRWSSRIGFHEEETGPGGRFRWTRRRFALWLQPAETRHLTLAHFSPGPEAVDVSATVDERRTYRRSLKAGESIVLALKGSSEGPRPIVFEVSRAFIPKRLGISQDRRELGLLSIEQP
jgi:O-antigen ligase